MAGLLTAAVRRQLLLLAVWAMMLSSMATAGQTCYHANGSKDSMTSNSPCNTNATFSACCNFQNSDVCLSSGLCLNTGASQQSHFLWATGCTDPTFQDPSCPKFCTGGKYYNPRLQFCNDTHACCNDASGTINTTDCCSSAFSIGKIGTVVKQLSPVSLAVSSSSSSSAPAASETTAAATSSGAASQTSDAQGSSSSSSSSSSAPSGGVVAGIAILAVALVLSLVALGLLVWKNKNLRRQLGTAAAQAPPQPPAPSSSLGWGAAGGVDHYRQQQQQQQQQHMYQQYQHTGSTAVAGTASPPPRTAEVTKAELYSPPAASELGG